MRDLAYVLSACLQIEDRRAWDQDLVRCYLDWLQQARGQRFDFDDCWNFYHQQMFHALLLWKPTLSMIERMMAAIDDLDSIGSCDGL